MEHLKHEINNNIIKNFISSIIDKQIGAKLFNLEQKNKKEINEIQILSKKGKELINNLSNISSKISKNIKIHTSNKLQPLNILSKNTKSKKNLHFNNKKNQNILLRKSFTPIKSFNSISKIKAHNKGLSRVSNKSVDLVIKKNRTNKINIKTIKNSLKSINKLKTKKSSKEIYKSPNRKKDKYDFNKKCKTDDRKYRKKNKIELDISYLDNEIDIDKIPIIFDEDQRISNLEIPVCDSSEKDESEQISERISIQLGPLIETIDNEKRIYFLGDNLFKKEIISKHIKTKSKYNEYNNPFLIIIEYIFDYLYIFLDAKSLFNLALSNKDYFKLILRLIITKVEKKLKEINKVLSDIKQINKDLIKEEKIKPFEFTVNSVRAISLLNTITVERFFNEKRIDFNNKYINLIFDLYFICIGKKRDIILYNSDKTLKEKYIINHFKNNNNKYIGPILVYEIQNILFNNEIINSLYNYSYNYINIISPNYFQKINKNIALLSFLIKNILEHIGIIKDLDNNKNLFKKYQLYNSRLQINQDLVKRIKLMKDLH